MTLLSLYIDTALNSISSFFEHSSILLVRKIFYRKKDLLFYYIFIPNKVFSVYLLF
jgi:hypothetical protein